MDAKYSSAFPWIEFTVPDDVIIIPECICFTVGSLVSMHSGVASAHKSEDMEKASTQILNPDWSTFVKSSVQLTQCIVLHPQSPTWPIDTKR